MTKFVSLRCYNPFIFEGRSVDKFYFFQNGEIVASSDWFGNNNSYRWIEFPFDIKLKRKLDLNSKDAFYMTNINKFDGGERRWDIYIPVELCEGFEKKENVKGWTSATTQSWHDTFSFLVKGSKRQELSCGEPEISRMTFSMDCSWSCRERLTRYAHNS